MINWIKSLFAKKQKTKVVWVQLPGCDFAIPMEIDDND